MQALHGAARPARRAVMNRRRRLLRLRVRTGRMREARFTTAFGTALLEIGQALDQPVRGERRKNGEVENLRARPVLP